MTQTTVESVFGTKAGVVWRALNQNGPSNITNLVKITSMSREEVFSALGWLGREDKIALEQKGRELIFSLRESEEHQDISLQAPPRITGEEIVPKVKAKAKPKGTKTKPPKKAKKGPEIKTPQTQDEYQAKESNRTKDFLLH